jgi:hypothetical protein
VNLPDTVLAMIQAAVPGITVYDGIIPSTPADRYAIVYIDDGTLAAVSACNTSDSATLRWQVTSVAGDRQKASWIATKIRDTTVDSTPNPDGWVCGRIQHVFSERPGRDETVADRPVVYKPDVYDLLATRV